MSEWPQCLRAYICVRVWWRVRLIIEHTYIEFGLVIICLLVCLTAKRHTTNYIWWSFHKKITISPSIIDNILCYFIDLHPTSFVIYKYNCSFCLLSSFYRALFKHSLICLCTWINNNNNNVNNTPEYSFFPNGWNAKKKKNQTWQAHTTTTKEKK